MMLNVNARNLIQAEYWDLVFKADISICCDRIEDELILKVYA